MPSLVSVIIPSYNHEHYVGEAIDSVLACSLPADCELELIVVDDGSTDRSLEVLSGYAPDRRVVVLTQSNQGAHQALQRGLEHASGDYLFLLNSDDRFHRERIRAFVARFEADPTLLTLTSWIRLIDAAGQELGVKEAYRNLEPWPPRHRGGRLADLGDPRLALLETNYVSTSSNLAFRRELLHDTRVRFPALRYTHDWYFALAAATAGPLQIVEEPLIDYRVHASNTIKEGAEATGPAVGQRRMEFEIAWTLGAHSASLRAEVARDESGHRDLDLARRQWRSLPPFVSEGSFAQLLQLRGTNPDVPKVYRELLDPDHPLHAAASTPEATAGLPAPELSIIIPTRDRWATLEETLLRLQEEVATLPAERSRVVEVLVVDDGSTQPPPTELEKRFEALSLSVVTRPPLGPAAARNFGIARARAARTLLLGDDTPPVPGSLAHHLDAALSDRGLQGRIDWDPAREVTPLMHFLAPRGPQFYFEGLENGRPIPYTAVLGSNLSAPTEWFRLEPFDEGFPAAAFEDTELAYRWSRRGWSVLFSDAAAAWHRHHYEQLEVFLERQRRAGHAARYAVLHRAPGMLWTIAVAPAIVTLWRWLKRPKTREQSWDLACRLAFLQGFLRGRRPPVSPSSAQGPT